MSFNEADVGVLNKEEIELAGGSKRKEKKAGGKWKLHVTWNREEKKERKGEPPGEKTGEHPYMQIFKLQFMFKYNKMKVLT